MNRKTKYTLFVIISSFLLGILLFFFMRYIQRAREKKIQNEAQQLVERDIIELQALGFSSDDPLFSCLKERQRRLNQDMPVYEREQEAICALQKKVLLSYIHEAKLLRKQSVHPQSSVMRFVHDKIVRLTIAVADLERQMNNNETDSSEFQKRVDRMKEITRQSITHYKQQLRDYLQQGLAENDQRVQQARHMLSTRIKHYYYM